MVAQRILASYDYANSRYEFVIYFFVKWDGGTGEGGRLSMRKTTCEAKE